jgi:hypothetical protein
MPLKEENMVLYSQALYNLSKETKSAVNNRCFAVVHSFRHFFYELITHNSLVNNLHIWENKTAHRK